MNRTISHALAAVASVAAVISVGGAAQATDALTVCLNEDAPPYSAHHGKKTGGFDLAVAEAVARHLDRPLAVQWFESELDEDSNLTLESNALLSDGLCQLVGGYPLIEHALGKPGAESSRLPGHEGGKPSDRRRRVKLGTLVPSKPYFYAPLTVVLGAPAATKPIATLADLQGLKLGAEEGTLADAILMIYGNRRFENQVTHVTPGKGQLLPDLEKGMFDATLVSLRQFDAYRDSHPDSKLKASGFYHRIGFNMGFVTLANEQKLLDAVNQALSDLLNKGELPPLATAAGMTYVPPRSTEGYQGITLTDLYKD